jgi:hypothetical protein
MKVKRNRKKMAFKIFSLFISTCFLFTSVSSADMVYSLFTLRPSATVKHIGLDIENSFSQKMSSAGEDNPITYIKHANKHIEEGKTFDAIIITAVDDNMAAYLRGHFEALRGKLFPNNARVEVVSRQSIHPSVYKNIYNHGGTVQAMNYVLEYMKEWGLTEQAKVLMLHTAGSGSRNYPLTAAAKGNKGLMEVPSAIDNTVLSQVDQAIRQYHQVLDNTPEGTITVGTCDHTLAISADISGKSRAIEVFGNKRPLDDAIAELKALGVIDDIVDGKIVTSKTNTEIQQIIDSIIKDHSKAPHFYDVTTLGQIWADSDTGAIVKMIEKPTDWPTLKLILEQGYTNINWWNHRYTLEAARIASQLYTPFIGQKLDFSIDILQAFTQPDVDHWLVLKTKKKDVSEITQEDRDKYGYIYELAKQFKDTVGNLGYLDAGENSFFTDTGANTELFDLYTHKLFEGEDSILLRSLLNISQLDFIGDNVICIASPKTKQAIEEGRITFGENARAVFIGSDITKGHIEGRGLVVSSEADILVMKGDGIAWSVRRAPPVVEIADGKIITDLYYEGAIERCVWDIAKNPAQGYGNPFDRYSKNIQDVGPGEVEKVVGVVRTSSAGTLEVIKLIDMLKDKTLPLSSREAVTEELANFGIVAKIAIAELEKITESYSSFTPSSLIDIPRGHYVPPELGEDFAPVGAIVEPDAYYNEAQRIGFKVKVYEEPGSLREKAKVAISKIKRAVKEYEELEKALNYMHMNLANIRRFEGSYAERTQVQNEQRNAMENRLDALRKLKNVIVPTDDLKGYVDLHCHTFYSDGYNSPSAVVFDAWRQGIKSIAITDHNTFEGLEEAMLAGKILGIRVIPGIEFNFREDNLGVAFGDVLVYFPVKDIQEYGMLMGEVAEKGILGKTNQRIYWNLKKQWEVIRRFNERHKAGGLQISANDVKGKLGLHPNIWQLGEILFDKYGAEFLTNYLNTYIKNNYPELYNAVQKRADDGKFIKGKDGLPVIAAALDVGSIFIRTDGDVYIDEKELKTAAYANGPFSLALQEIMDYVKPLGGVVVLPHPNEDRFKGNAKDVAKTVMELLRQYEFDGVELSGKYKTAKEYDDGLDIIHNILQEKPDILITIGSDYHGNPSESNLRMGLGRDGLKGRVALLKQEKLKSLGLSLDHSRVITQLEKISNYHAKSSSSGTTLDELLGEKLSPSEAIDFVLNHPYTFTPKGIENIARELVGNVIYSDSLQQSETLQHHVKQAQITGRKFFLINKEGHNLSFLKDLGIGRSTFVHILHQNSNSPDDIANIVAATLINHNIRQVRVFASTQDDLKAWSKQGLIEALVLLLEGNKFAIRSDYSQQHIEYIRTHRQALIAA